MKRAKGICVAALVALTGGMTGAVVSASADAGGRGQTAVRPAARVVAHATPNGQNSGRGVTRDAFGARGASGARGLFGAPSAPSARAPLGVPGAHGPLGVPGAHGPLGAPGARGVVGTPGASGARSPFAAGGQPGPANGNTPHSAPVTSSGGGDGGDSRGGGSRDGGSNGQGSGSDRGQAGRGLLSSGSDGSQGSSQTPGRGSANGTGRGKSGSNGNGGGSSVAGQRGRCTNACFVGQQPTASPIAFVPTPSPTQGTTPPVTTPTTPPVTTPVSPSVSPPVNKPDRGGPTSTSYSTSATAIHPARPAAITGLVGLGATVSPAARGGSLATGSRLPAGTPRSIGDLLGTAPAVPSSTHAGVRSHDGAARSTVVTQPIAQRTIIQSIEQVVPPTIWLALAAALAFGALGTGWALYSGHRVRRQAGAFAAMSTAALTDQLTGVLNRRGFLEAVEREFARARRYERGFVLAYVDVRGLKGVNDTEGHRAGDELLKEAARLLQDSARADDVVGRLGGDEMGLLLVEQGAEGADAVRRRVAAEVPARREKLGLHSSWDLTIGTASFPDDGETVDDLLRIADLRLYEQRGIDLIDRATA